MKSDLTEQKEKYTPKVMHGYYGGGLVTIHK